MESQGYHHRANIMFQSSEAAEWKAKYDRLLDTHKRLQQTNQDLEEKLLRIVDQFDAEKNHLTRDLATQTQKLVQAKLTYAQLADRNQELSNDLQLAINLLQQNRPTSFVSPRVDTLPQEIRARVKSYLAGGERSTYSPVPSSNNHGGEFGVGTKRIIRVPIHEDISDIESDEKVSAAILAKVLEERAKERKAQRKFCIDVGTQTVQWGFPGSASSVSSPTATKSTKSKEDRKPSPLLSGPPLPATTGDHSPGFNWPHVVPGTAQRKPREIPPNNHNLANGNPANGNEVIQILKSISLDDYRNLTPRQLEGGGGQHRQTDESTTIFAASIIRTPPPPSNCDQGRNSHVEQSENEEGEESLISLADEDVLPKSKNSDSNQRPSSNHASILDYDPCKVMTSAPPPIAAECRPSRLRKSITCSSLQTDI